MLEMYVMQNPHVLVVMPFYNARPYLRRAVESILVQTYASFVLMAFNDGSTDGSEQEVIAFEDKRIILLRQENQGPGVAMNRAVQYAQENRIPFVARMDADDLSMPMRLEIQLGLLDKNPGIAACSSNCYYIDRETEEIVGTSTVSSRPNIIKWEIKNGLRGLVQGASFFRTNALVAVGGYRPEFRYAEETDLFLRLAEKFDLANAKEFLYKIRINNKSLSMRDVQKNLLYHFYALECSRNRRNSVPEESFDTFLEKTDWKSSLRLQHEKFVLKLWRSNIANRNYLLLLLASLIDPRRAVARVLRKL